VLYTIEDDRQVESLAVEVRSAGHDFAVIDAAHVRGETELMAHLAGALRFPSYFGHNWDAVDECLGDLEWIDADGYVLCVRQAATLWRHDPRQMAKLIQACECAAFVWGEEGIAFHLLLAW
jgi:hypothetical protein